MLILAVMQGIMGGFCFLPVSLYIFQILYNENVAFGKSQSPKCNNLQ